MLKLALVDRGYIPQEPTHWSAPAAPTMPMYSKCRQQYPEYLRPLVKTCLCIYIYTYIMHTDLRDPYNSNQFHIFSYKFKYIWRYWLLPLEGQGGQGQAPAEVKPQKDDAHCIETETLCRQAKAIAERCVKLCYAAEINRTVKYGLDMKESYPLVI